MGQNPHIHLNLKKMGFKPNIIRRDKGSLHIHQGNNPSKGNYNSKYTYASTGSPNFIKQILLNLKTQINSNTIIVSDFSNTFSPFDRSTGQKVNRDTLELNNTIDKMDLIDINRIFHPKLQNAHSSQQATKLSLKHITY